MITTITSYCRIILGFIWLALCSVSSDAGEAGLRYSVRFEGAPDGRVRNTLTASSLMVQLRQRPPATPALLQKRAERDIVRLTTVLHSQGYYDALIAVRFDGPASEMKVVIDLDCGARYTVGSVRVLFRNELQGGLSAPDAVELGLDSGKPAEGRAIIGAGKRLLRWFSEHGYPFPEIESRRLIVNHADHTVIAEFVVNPGPSARLGTFRVTGLKEVDGSFVEDVLQWETGIAYDAGIMDACTKRLQRTGLFTIVGVNPERPVDNDGQVNGSVELHERKPRSIETTVGYYTDKGFDSKLAWQHRNCFGRAELLKLEAALGEVVQSGEAWHRKPLFDGNERVLLMNLGAARDNPDAYLSSSFHAQVGTERRILRNTRGGYGLAFRRVTVEQTGESENFGLISIPLFLSHSTADNPLDPAAGSQSSIRCEPYYDVMGSDAVFLKMRGTHIRYVQLWNRPTVIAAGRVSAGTIFGAAESDIPADERFYAGGGGSVRGYAFQSLGPMTNNVATGGRSMIEVSLELRTRISESGNCTQVPLRFGLRPNTVESRNLPIHSRRTWLRGCPGLRCRNWT